MNEKTSRTKLAEALAEEVFQNVDYQMALRILEWNRDRQDDPETTAAFNEAIVLIGKLFSREATPKGAARTSINYDRWQNWAKR